MRFSLIVRLALMAVLMCGVSAPAYAVDDCSNAQIAQGLSTQTRNLAVSREKKLNDAWKNPSQFNSLYCGANFTSMFNQLGTGLGGAVWAMVQSLLTNLMNQACASAIAPIQNAASQLCIPMFSAANFNINLGLPGTSANFCSGMQLLNVTPTMTPPASSTPISTKTPLLP